MLRSCLEYAAPPDASLRVDHDHAGMRLLREQALDRGGATLQCETLVDVALVRDLAGIDGRNIVQQDDTPVEQEAARGIVRIREPYCIADSVEPVRVERRRRELGALPVPRRDMGAAHPDFELAGARHQLELDARDRDAHYAGTIDRKM